MCVCARAHHDIDIDVDRVWCDSQRPLTLPPQQRYAPPHRLATGSVPSVPHVTALIPPPSSHPGSSQQVAPSLRLGFGSPQNEKERDIVLILNRPLTGARHRPQAAQRPSLARPCPFCPTAGRPPSEPYAYTSEPFERSPASASPNASTTVVQACASASASIHTQRTSIHPSSERPSTLPPAARPRSGVADA